MLAVGSHKPSELQGTTGPNPAAGRLTSFSRGPPCPQQPHNFTGWLSDGSKGILLVSARP